ncbi:MAG: GntR family transcriptional regulator [Pyrinomonadaceae bacterium]
MLNIQIKDRAEGPVYLQVRQQLEAAIRNKDVTSGESLPQPAALAQKLSVDKGEVQRAYFELEQLGLVKKSARKDFLTGKEVSTFAVA